MKKCLLVIFAAGLLFSCELFHPKADLDTVKNITVTPGFRSMTLSWDPVDNASSYAICYSEDGSDPTTSSTTPVEGTNYTHTGLGETNTYKYKIQAIADGYNSSLSSATQGHQTVLKITITGNYSDYKDKNVIVRFLDVPYDPELDDVDGHSEVFNSVIVKPDANGNIIAESEFDRTIYLGFAIIIDMDGSGDLNTGDYVTGTGTSGDGLYEYSFYKSFLTKSYSIECDWSGFKATHFF